LNKILAVLFLILFISSSAQKHLYDVQLLGKSIGSLTVEKIDKGNGEVEYKLNSASEVSIFFTKKSSVMTLDAVYKNGKLVSSYCQNIKDDATEIVTVAWDGVKYIIKKGQEVLEYDRSIDFSAVLLYFNEPINRTRIFSERLGQFTTYTKLAPGIYESKLQETGVTNTYHYKNGTLYELEMSKGASVFLKLIH
jgi:hypothetical protein